MLILLQGFYLMHMIRVGLGFKIQQWRSKLRPIFCVFSSIGFREHKRNIFKSILSTREEDEEPSIHIGASHKVFKEVFLGREGLWISSLEIKQEVEEFSPLGFVLVI